MSYCDRRFDQEQEVDSSSRPDPLRVLRGPVKEPSGVTLFFEMCIFVADKHTVVNMLTGMSDVLIPIKLNNKQDCFFRLDLLY